MKKIIITLALLLSLNSYSQKVYDLDKKTNSISYTKTNDVAIYQGEKKVVYLSKNNKLFIFVTSKKSGKEYKKYIN
jgi:sugar diacid utilization regulator